MSETLVLALTHASHQGRPGRRVQSPQRDRTTEGRVSSSPSFQESAIEPVPQEIEHDLFRSSAGVCDWHLEANAAAYVLTFIYRDLHLRHDVHVGLRAIFQIAIGNQFEHRRPHAADARFLTETRAERRPREYRAGRFLCRRRLLGAELCLQEHP